jgi:hypothetical protein
MGNHGKLTLVQINRMVQGRTNPQLIANARDIFHIASSNLPQKIRIDIIMVKSICP